MISINAVPEILILLLFFLEPKEPGMISINAVPEILILLLFFGGGAPPPLLFR